MIIKEFSKKLLGKKGNYFYENEYAEYTYPAIHNISLLLSQHISEELKGQKKVGVFVKDPVTTIFIILALWEKKIIPVLINPTLPVAEMLLAMQGAGAKLILTDYSIGGESDGSSPQLLDVKMHLLQAIMMHTFMSPKKTEMAEGSVILFTSGTTNVPKAVLLSKENLLSAFEAGNSIFAYKKRESWLLSLPIYHVGGFSIFFRAYRAEQALVVPQDLSAEAILASANKTNVRYISLVPTQLRRILSEKEHFAYKPKAILLGGAAAAPDLIDACVFNNLPVYKVYGSTETSAFSCILRPRNLKKKGNASGVPVEGTAIKIINDKGKEVSIGESGEICIASAAVSKGYIGLKAESAQRFKKGFYHTGDLGYIDRQGFLFVTGRKNDLINSGGEKINPADVLTAVKNVLTSGKSLVFGVPDREWGEAVALLLYAVKKPVKKEVALLMKNLKSELPSFKMPKYLYYYRGDVESLLQKGGKRELQKAVTEGIFRSLL